MGLEEAGHFVEDAGADPLGAQHLVGGNVLALLDVPDDLRRDTLAVGFQQVAAQRGHEHRPKRLEGVDAAAEIRAGLFDRRAHIGKSLCALAANLGHLGIDQRQAEIGAVGHALGRTCVFHGLDKGFFGPRNGQRIARMRMGQRVEHKRTIGHIAGHRTFDPERIERQKPLAARHPAHTGAQPDDAAIAGGNAQAAAEVVAGGKPGLARRKRAGRAARRAANSARQIPRVAGGAEDRVEGIGTGDLRHVRFRHRDAAAFFKRHHGIV